MRISELSRLSGISLPTLKYYLRERLLPPGTPVAPNRAEYGEEHLHRLRLIRVLMEIGGLGIAGVRSVLDAVADPRLSLHDLLGVAHRLLGPPPDRGEVTEDVAAARREIDAFVSDLRWRVSPDAPARRMLADALVALRRLGRDYGADVFARYAAAADALAREEIERTPGGPPTGASRAETVEFVVVGTVVFEAALAALRRMAQEHYSARRFARTFSP